MAISAKSGLPIRHEVAFPEGAVLTSDPEPVFGYANGKRSDVQQVDEVSGLRVWSCTVLDGDSTVSGPNKSVKVKILAGVRPIVPAGGVKVGDMTLTPIEFEGLSAKAYSKEVMEGRFKVAWSFTATGFANTGAAAKSAAMAGAK